MSDAPRRTKKELEIVLRESIITAGRWDWTEKCREEDFVNCTFAEKGACRNPRHKGGVS